MNGLVAEGDRRRLKGGRITSRDHWYGLQDRPDFPDFRQWWHRVGKFEYDRDHISDRASAGQAYGDWVSAGRPKAS